MPRRWATRRRNRARPRSAPTAGPKRGGTIANFDLDALCWASGSSAGAVAASAVARGICERGALEVVMEGGVLGVAVAGAPHDVEAAAGARTPRVNQLRGRAGVLVQSAARALLPSAAMMRGRFGSISGESALALCHGRDTTLWGRLLRERHRGEQPDQHVDLPVFQRTNSSTCVSIAIL